MDKFDQILELFKNSNISKLSIKGKERVVKAAGLYRTINMLEDPGYIKMVFEDNAMLLMIMNGKLFYLDENPPVHIEKVKTEDIGKVENVKFKDVEYTLANAFDYQFVQQLLIGTILEIEGEVAFSDYMDENENMLSLGIEARTGKRMDFNPSLISEDDIEIIL